MISATNTFVLTYMCVFVGLLAGLIPYELWMTDRVLVLFHLQGSNVLILRKQLLFLDCYVVCNHDDEIASGWTSDILNQNSCLSEHVPFWSD